MFYFGGAPHTVFYVGGSIKISDMRRQIQETYDNQQITEGQNARTITGQKQANKVQSGWEFDAVSNADRFKVTNAFCMI